MMSDKPRVLIVDDTRQNIEILNESLKLDYSVSFALNGYRALELAASDPKPDIILLDIMMADMDGYEVCTQLRMGEATKDIPVIFITSMSETDDERKGLELGAVDYITKPVNPAVMLARVKAHVELKRSREQLKQQNKILDQRVRERTKELEETRLEIIHRLGLAAEYKDNETGFHVMRMSKYAELIAIKWEMEDSYISMVATTAPMHDVGKIGIPDRILLKEGKLNDEEWAEMKKHPLIGAAIIGDHPSALLQFARIAALTHHERWDGKGYPQNLEGDDIPVIGRILAIADVFDALTSKRPYKEAWLPERAFELIRSEKGSQFDPILVDLFLSARKDILAVKELYREPSSTGS